MSTETETDNEQTNSSALAKANASIARLELKNSDLIGKLKVANDRAEAAEKEAKRVTEAEDRATKAETALQSYKAEAALNATLLANNVDPKDIPMIVKATKNDIKPDDNGEPTIEGKSIEAWGKDYFAKDGLRYVRAADNSGSGATGNQSTKSNSHAGKEFNLTEYGQLKATDAAAAAAWATETGNGYLNNI